MNKLLALISSFCFICCAHQPRCGNFEGAKIVFEEKGTCQIRIRQVVIGSELKIPNSLKGPAIARYKLDWIESDFKNGRIEFGHFVLIPESGVKP